jgi:hypothetical protein
VDKIEKNEMGGACSMYGGQQRCILGFWWGNLRKRDNLEDPGLEGRIILRWVFRKWPMGAIELIDLSQDRDRWRALVNVVMNLRVP